MTSSFTRKTPHNVSLKLKDPANLHLQQSPSTHCLCNINVSREENSPERSCNDSSEAAAATEEDDDVVKTGNECDVSVNKNERYACMHAQVHMYTFTSAYKYMHMRVRTHAYTHTHIGSHTHMISHIHTHTHTHTCPTEKYESVHFPTDICKDTVEHKRCIAVDLFKVMVSSHTMPYI